MFTSDDTIAALSSPAGIGRRAIVRLSGPDAYALGEPLVTLLSDATPLHKVGGFTRLDALCRFGPAPADVLPVELYCFRAPASYTRQDLLELHLPGGVEPARLVLQQLLQRGARPAEPGEFTARAFFSGRIDLSAAEAVADVIHAAGEAQHRSAVAAVEGRLWRLCRETADQAADALATVEASIDLAEEDIALADPGELAGELRRLGEQLGQTARHAARLDDRTAQPLVVLAGPANAGKSSLLNALCGTPRAIISEQAGTTRDVLSGQADLGDGRTVTLLDVAGFGAADRFAAIATRAALQAVQRADAILFVIDPATPQTTAETLLANLRSHNPQAVLLILASKVDRPAGTADDRPALADRFDAPLLRTSAVTGEGLDALRRQLADRLDLHAWRGGEGLALHDRQRRCLDRAGDALGRTGEMLDTAGEIADVAELAAVELRSALGALGEISGEIVTEDVLGKIFARFCVGK